MVIKAGDKSLVLEQSLLFSQIQSFISIQHTETVPILKYFPDRYYSLVMKYANPSPNSPSLS